MTKPGLFVTFEGGDGSGKTTQMQLLTNRLRQMGHDVLETAEPGGTPIGKQIRRILLDPENQSLSPRAELLLYFASRAQNVDEWIRPALKAGRVVVCDRFTDSTLAYQGLGRNLTEDVVMQVHAIACGEVMPDITIYLDIDYRTGLERARTRNAQRQSDSQPDETRMDEQAEEFHAHVRHAFQSLAERYPERIHRIDGSCGMDAVHAEIWTKIAPYV